MTHHMPSRQRGLGFIGLVLLVALIVAGGALVVRVLPAVVEYQAVNKAVKKAAGASTVAEARAVFDKAAAVDNIASLTGRDLEVAQSPQGLAVRFAYQREFPLAGPAFLTLKFSGAAP